MAVQQGGRAACVAVLGCSPVQMGTGAELLDGIQLEVTGLLICSCVYGCSAGGVLCV